MTLAGKSDMDNLVRYCMSPNVRASVNSVDVVDASASREFLYYSQAHLRANVMGALLGVSLCGNFSKGWNGSNRREGNE